MMTSKFTTAISLAARAHEDHCRNGGRWRIPYITHPVAVAGLVAQFGGDEDQQIAALLHDVLEGSDPYYAGVIERVFGSRVLAIVQGCTDGVPNETEEKPPWAERKQSYSWFCGPRARPATEKPPQAEGKEAYLAHLASAGADVLLVSGCDKLGCARALLEDLAAIGPAVFKRFTAKKGGTLWYYAEVSKIFTAAHVPMAKQLAQTVAEIRELAKKPKKGHFLASNTAPGQ